MSTLNSTTRAWLTAVLGAEYVLQWLPRGTHDPSKFLAPAQLTAFIELATPTTTPAPGSTAAAGAAPVDGASSSSSDGAAAGGEFMRVTNVSGIAFDPLSRRGHWRLDPTDLSVNYMCFAVKEHAGQRSATAKPAASATAL
jgi:hypothetical protein